MTPWEKHGGAAIFARHRHHLAEAMDCLRRIERCQTHGYEKEDWKAIRRLRVKTGLDAGDRNGRPALTVGSTVVMELPENDENFEHTMEALARVTDGITLGAYLINPEAGRDLVEFGMAIEAHEAKLRHALPNQRQNARNVLLVDSLVIAMNTISKEGQSARERAQAWLGGVMEKQYWYRREHVIQPNGRVEDAFIIEANVLTTRRNHDPSGDSTTEHETNLKMLGAQGVITIDREIPETVMHGLPGKKIEEVIEGHPATGMNVTVIGASKGARGVELKTDALDPDNLVIADLVNGRIMN